jgi:hypothetical protein
MFCYASCIVLKSVYVTEVDDTRRRFAFLNGGAVLSLPMFYLQGSVATDSAFKYTRIGEFISNYLSKEPMHFQVFLILNN